MQEVNVQEFLASALTGAAGMALLGSFMLWSWRNALNDLKKVPNLETRIEALEKQAIQHNETKEAVIRMEEQIKNLTEQVRALSDLLMRKVLNNNG